MPRSFCLWRNLQPRYNPLSSALYLASPSVDTNIARYRRLAASAIIARNIRPLGAKAFLRARGREIGMQDARMLSVTPKKEGGVLGQSDLEFEMRGSVRTWDGPKAVFVDGVGLSKTVDIAKAITTPTSQTLASGSSSSPISITSSPATPLPRPRGVPIYTSQLARTAYTPPQPSASTSTIPFPVGFTEQPKTIHPFFSLGNVRSKSTPLPPKQNRPRMLAHYSSTSDSGSTALGSQSSSWALEESLNVDRGRDEIDEVIQEVEKLEIRREVIRKPLISVTTLPRKQPVVNAAPQPVVSAIQSKVWKEDLPLFDHRTFKSVLKSEHTHPKVVYTSNAQEAADLVSCLRGDVLGFDMEWPTAGFKSIVGLDGIKKRVAVGGTWTGKKWEFKELKTALVQICDERMVLLIHLRGMSELPKCVVDLVTNPKIYKTGVQVRGDALKLARDFPSLFAKSSPQSLLELSWLARKVDPIHTGPGNTLIGLANLSRWYLGHELFKGDVRRSDWSKKLTPEQIQYAADDVYASLQLYLHFRQIAEKAGITLNLDEFSSNLGKTSIITSAGQRPTSPVSTTGGYVKGPSPAQTRALGLFSNGQTIAQMANDLSIKESTALSYVILAVQNLGMEVLPPEERRRLLSEIVPGSYVAKIYTDFLVEVRKGLEGSGGLGD